MIKIGTSGFSFPDWVGTIYPANIKTERYITWGGGKKFQT